MNTKAQKAIKSYRSGFNCSQSIVSAYSADMGFDNNLAMAVSCGFGGGMGRLQETCGAITGAFMILGVHSYKPNIDIKLCKDKAVDLVREFDERFKAIHGSTNCRKLIGCDLTTDEGMQLAKDTKLFETVCEKLIVDAVAILDELIKE